MVEMTVDRSRSGIANGKSYVNGRRVVLVAVMANESSSGS